MSNRASYNRVNPNIKVGFNREPALSVSERMTVQEIRQLLSNANLSTTTTAADVALNAAFRGLRQLIMDRRSNR